MTMKQVCKQQFVIATILMMMMMSMAWSDQPTLRESRDCRVKTKLHCTRIIFNIHMPNFSDKNKTMCCYSKYNMEVNVKYKERCGRCIDISDSSLQNLSVNTFSKFPNSTYIDISNNSLKDLRGTLFDNTVQISHLNLSYNDLQYLDNQTFSLTTQLTIFDLSYNSLKNLNNSIFSRTTELSNLNLSHNKLENLHNRTFFATTKLSHLDLSYNNLTNLDAITFLTTTELYYLNLNHNFLKKLDNHVFLTNVQLSRLDLGNNKLEFIDEELLFTLKKLRYLNFKNNQLSILDDERLFLQQKDLSSLIIANNHLVDINVKLLMSLKVIRHLDLSGNPFNCSCNLRIIMNWSKYHDVETNATCVNPMSTIKESWIILSNYTHCEQNISIYSDSNNEEDKGRCYDTEIWIVILVVSMFLSLALGCVLTWISTYCWRRYKKTRTEGRKAILDSTYDNMNENYYYPSATVAEEHTTSFCTPPEIPERPSLEQANNFPHKYEYVDISTSLHHTMTPSRKEAFNNLKTRHSTSSGNYFPKEINVSNDLYR